MKKIAAKLIYISLIALMISSCVDRKSKFPIYSLDEIKFVPDSLRSEQRTWITETVRAATNKGLGGDYEDVDDTIEQAELTSRRLFEVSIIGLHKKINNDSWQDTYINPSMFTKNERKIFDSLLVN